VDELYTERLKLRPLACTDADELFSARGDEEVMAYWDVPADADPAETAVVTDLLLADMRSGTSMYWTVRLREDATFVGICDLSEIGNGESADIGFLFARRFWGRGFGGEVVRCLLSYASSLNLKSVSARIHSGNVRSRRLLSNAGFQMEKEMPGYEVRPGVFRDCLQFECRLNQARSHKPGAS